LLVRFVASKLAGEELFCDESKAVYSLRIALKAQNGYYFNNDI
jgi:hypothetical protein